MTTLAVQTPRAYEGGDFSQFPVVASDIIYEGSAVGLVDGSGHARPLNSADRFAGFATRKADNASGSAADIRVTVQTRGRIQISVTGAVITDVGQPVYATDDNAFQFIATSAVFIGYIWRFVSAGVAIVEFDAANLKDPYDGWTHVTTAVDVTGDSQDNGKCFWITVDGKKYTAPAVASASVSVRVINAGAFGTLGVSFDLQAADNMEGPGVTASDGAGYINTKATARRGDYADFDFVDAAGYTVTASHGTWARE